MLHTVLTSFSSAYVFTPGAIKLASSWYAFGPIADRKIERFLLTSLIPFASNNCSLKQMELTIQKKQRNMSKGYFRLIAPSSM